MAVVSDVEIRLRADIAQLRQDMERARREVGGAMDRIGNMARTAGAALGAIGAVLGAGAFVGFIKGAIDATDAVSDISQKTGLAVEEIAGLQLWFQKGAMEAGMLETTMAKLSKNIAEGGADFAKLGISTKTATGELRANAAVLADTADKFAAMQDGTAKTAIAIQLFGKSGADLIPMLNEGSAGLREMNEMAEKLGLTFDQKVVDQAGEFNDTLDFIGMAAQGVGRKVAAELLPTLQSMAGSFLKLITEGDGVRKMAQGIATGFKVLYTAGVSIVALFNAVGKTIGGTVAFVSNNLTTLFTALRQGIEGDYAKAWQTIQSGGAAAGDILSTTFADVKRDLSAAAGSITDVWTGAGGETVAALTGMQKKGKYVSDEAAKDAKKQAEAYAALRIAANELVASTGREAAGMEPLNAAQKLTADLDTMIREGKIKLRVEQEAYLRQQYALIETNLASVESQKAYAKMQETSGKLEKEMSDARASAIKSATEEAEKNEQLAKTFGMTAVQVERLELARLQEQLAQRSSKGLTLDEIENLEQLIALKERSAAAVADTQAMEESKQFWGDIEKTAHDTFVSIADGGKNAFQRLKETAKNMFFDWLYQQTLKKWIVNIQTSTSGNPLESITGKEKSAAGTSSWAQQIGTTIGAYMVGSSLNKGISNGYETGSGMMTFQKVATAAASAYFGPIGGAIAGAVSGMVNRAFGMKSKEYADNSTLSGSISTGGFAGSVDSAWTQKGGWFRSDKSGVDKAAVDVMTASGLTAAYDAIKMASTDYAKVLGLNADSIAARAQSISIALGKDEAANQKAIADFFGGVADTVAGELLPGIAKFQQQGETAAATLQRVAGGFQVVDAVLQALTLGSQQAFGAVGAASIEARERLITLSGGIESLAVQTQFFADNFMTQAEKLAPLQRGVNDRLVELGYAGVETGEQFRNAVMALAEGGALATEAGAKTYAGLMAVAPGFKTLTEYLAEIRSLNLDTLRGRADDAVSMLSDSVDRQKDIVAAAYAKAMGAVEKQIDSVNNQVARTTALSSALRSSLGTVETDAQQAGARGAAGAQIAAALAIAKASGVLPSADDLRDALSTLNRDSSDQFSTLAEYQRATAAMNVQLESLGGLSDEQLSTAERQLLLLEQQKEAAQMASDSEITRLDSLVEWAQHQVNAINGQGMILQSVEGAMLGVYAAIRALGNATGGYAYEDRQVGSVVNNVPMVANMPQSDTLTGGNALVVLEQIEKRMAAMEVSSAQTAADSARTAQLLNNVTAGGSAMLTEPA